MKFGIFKDYIGDMHFQAFFRVAGLSGVMLATVEIGKYVDMLIELTMSSLLEAISGLCTSPMVFPAGHIRVAGMLYINKNSMTI
jgi:hypothetical protein